MDFDFERFRAKFYYTVEAPILVFLQGFDDFFCSLRHWKLYVFNPSQLEDVPLFDDNFWDTLHDPAID